LKPYFLPFPCVLHCFLFFTLPDRVLCSVLLRRQFLFTSDAAEELKHVISKKNHELVYLYISNLVDEVWKEARPEPPNKPVRVHDLKYAGLDVASKLSSLRSELVQAGSSAIIVTALDEIAWLLNLVMHLNKQHLLLTCCTDRYLYTIIYPCKPSFRILFKLLGSNMSSSLISFFPPLFFTVDGLISEINISPFFFEERQ